MRSFRHVAHLVAMTFLGILLTATHAHSQSEDQTVRVTARALNVRTADGNKVCSVKKNTELHAIGIHPDGERIKVKLNSPGCPGEGWVYANYVLPNSKAAVDTANLSLRAGPSTAKKWLCGLPQNTVVEITDESARPGWFKVAVPNPPSGCPSEGFVHGSYLKPESSFFSQLPVVHNEETRDANTEAGVNTCETGDCEVGKKNTNVDDLKNIAAAASGPQGPFATEMRKLIADPNYKSEDFPKVRDGMIQFPILGKKGKVGPCGSARYNPDSGPRGVDAYIKPASACAFTAALQEWKKNFCPDSNQGCRLAWGDMSHKTRAQWSGHKTHANGHCIDLRPLRSGSFQDAGFSTRKNKITDPSYDSDMTAKMIAVLKKYGGSGVTNAEPPYFNDTRCETKKMGGHTNHIHICFNEDNPQVQSACENLVIDPQVCPELQ